MAKCKLCDKSGWFLGVNADGVCASCEPVLVGTVESNARVLKQSLEIAETTKRLDTMLSRYETALSVGRELRKFERRGISTVSPEPSVLMRRVKKERLERVVRWLEDELLAARVKSQAATTPAAIVRPYSKLLEKMSDIYAALPDVSSIEEIEVRVRGEMDLIRLKTEIDKAEKLAFKGQKKRACDAFLDALYLLRTDSIPDEEQGPLIALVEAKIVELGGEVPQAGSRLS